MVGESRIGVTGLAVMGANLARNIGRHGVPVAVHNRTTARTARFMAAYGGEGTFTAAENPEDFVTVLERPRRILIMVKAGAPVDDVIEELSPLLDEGDILIDGGNSHFADTKRRAVVCAQRGLRFLGVGVSGCRAVRRARFLGRASCPAVTRPRTAKSRAC
jgi:6-phosphogluconate dehydrogenase